MTDTVTGWTPELFAQFWAAPDPAPLPGFVTEDVVGHWPGNRKMRGTHDSSRRSRTSWCSCPTST